MSLRVKRVKVVREDCARSEYAAGATWHDLHAFASARRREKGDNVGQFRGRLRINLVISIGNKFSSFAMLCYRSIVNVILRNKFSFRSEHQTRLRVNSPFLFKV